MRTVKPYLGRLEGLFPRARSFWFGLTLPLRSLRLVLAHPRLLFWCALPILLTAVIYAWIIARAQLAAHAWLSHQMALWGLSPGGWLEKITLLLAQLLLLLIGAFTFSFVAGVAASPFNDLLAESTEPFALGLPAAPRVGLAHKLRLLGIDVLKTIAATGATLAALLLSFVPVVNLAAFALACLLLTFQYISYPQTRRGLGLADGVAFLRARLFACLGFGIAHSLLFTIPFVSALTLPLAVVGGTLLVARSYPGPDRPYTLR
jgi:uncharacterized protein involved in cysteine biosynthesis